MRQLKLKVDVISMSATPIPRTLQMSLAGPARHQRDRDAARGPPAGQDLRRRVRRAARQAGAGARGRARGPGVLPAQPRRRHRRDRRAAARAVPEADVHRRPRADGREAARGAHDGASCAARPTCWSRPSIIESGIDIPQANTLIVDRADLFGLSQLYQIRGRVGRSRERAYAYLLYPSAAALTPEAADRLSALSDYTELGAGFKVAMRDLELRGAGNLLGDEQSGHVAALGFELYMQMLDEAVRELDPDEDGAEPPEPVRLDINVDAYVPGGLHPVRAGEGRRAPRIAGARENSELMELRDRARGPLRRDPGAAREPDHAPAGADQARSRGRDRGLVQGRPAGGHADRARRRDGAPAARDPARARTTRRGAPSCRCACPTTRLQRFPAVVRAADALLSVQAAA